MGGVSPRREISVLSCLDAVVVEDSEAVGSQAEDSVAVGSQVEDSVAVGSQVEGG